MDENITKKYGSQAKASFLSEALIEALKRREEIKKREKERKGKSQFCTPDNPQGQPPIPEFRNAPLSDPFEEQVNEYLRAFFRD